MRILPQGKVFIEGEEVSGHVITVVGTHMAGQLPAVTVEFHLDDIVRIGDTFHYYIGGRRGENKRI